jgi:hypothetical protein
MKRVFFVCLFLCLTTSLLSQSNPVSLPIGASQADPKNHARILDQYGKVPLTFEANHGQTDSQVKFLSHTSGYTLFLTGDSAVLSLSGKKSATDKARIAGATHSLQAAPHARKPVGILRMKLRNANADAKVTGVDELVGTSNYFIGNDPSKWRTNVPTYAKVEYEGIYPGIDLVYYGNQRQLECDFVVAPGADPRRIGFEVRGAKQILQGARGELVFQVGDDEVRWHKPVVYQERDGARQLVAARYVVTDGNRVRFFLGKYDARRSLYIDPLIYSTYLGGSDSDEGLSIAVDNEGAAYVTGITWSADFPTMNPLQTANGGGADVFVAKINSAGSSLVYSTYLGGSEADWGQGIAVDSAGNAHVTGVTDSTDFPVTPGSFQTNLSGVADAFVTEINPAGSALVYSTYLGGSGGSAGTGIAVDNTGNAHVTGLAGTAFPTTSGAFQTSCNAEYSCAIVSEVSPTGSALVYSTYLGGTGGDQGSAIALDTTGNAYVTGFTRSTDFPVTPGAFQTICGGCSDGDAFVTEFNSTESALVYSTYLGGSGGSEGVGIAVDSAANAYVTGSTYSTNFPTTPGAFQTTCSYIACAVGEVFVSKINPEGSALVYSTYLGGSGGNFGGGSAGASVVVDGLGSSYITGSTESKDFPTTPGAFQTVCKGCGKTGNGAAFVTKFNPAGSALAYSTYLGGNGSEGSAAAPQEGNGIALDTGYNVYVTGATSSPHFPTMNPLQRNYGGNTDAFVSKIDLRLATTTALSCAPNPSGYGQAVTFAAVVTSSAGAPPDGEAISFEKGETVLGTGTLNGGSATFTTTTLKIGTTAVKAVYGGDSNFAGSTSKAVKQVVEKAD